MNTGETRDRVQDFARQIPKVFLLSSLTMLLSGPVAFGQMNTADITGSVTDPSGAFVRGATVTAVQASTDEEHSVSTNDAGEYLVAQLPLGEYRLTVEAAGFEQAVREGVIVHAGDHVRQGFGMRLGRSDQSMTVESTIGALQVESAEVKNVIEKQQVRGLPLKDREFMELAILSPGVVNPPGGTRGDSLQQTGKLINVLGNRTGHNLMLVDGVSVIDEYFNNVVLSPPPDATREFNMDLTDYSAEFGGKSGAVINVITESGTNDLHGAVYEFIRNDIFDAQNYFAPPNIPSPFHENQFGATLGGPIVKGKAFFFVNYDGQRLRESLSQLFSVPTVAERLGNLAGMGTVYDPITKIQIVGNDLSNDPAYSSNNSSTKAALALLSLLPLPTGSGNRNNLTSIGQETIDANNYTARVDYVFSTDGSASVRASVFDANELIHLVPVC